MFRFLESLIDPYCDYPVEDRPPTELWPFLKGLSRPFWPVFAVTAVLSVVVAGIEIWLISYVGRLVDLLSSSEPRSFWAEHGFEMLLVGLFLLFIRPLIQMFDVGLLNNAILPNFGTLIRWHIIMYCGNPLAGLKMTLPAGSPTGSCKRHLPLAKRCSRCSTP